MGILDKIKGAISKGGSYPEIPSKFPLPLKGKSVEELPVPSMAPEEPIRHELPVTEKPGFGLPEEIPEFPPIAEFPKPIEHKFPERSIISPGTPLPPPEETKPMQQIPSSVYFEIIKGKLEALQAKIEKIEHQLDIVLSLQKTQTSGKYF